MKIIKDNRGYATGIIMLILLIPILLLLVITIEEYEHDVNSTVESLESNKIKTSTENFEEELILLTKQSLHEVSLDVIGSGRALTNSRKELKEVLQSKVDNATTRFLENNIIISCHIDGIDSSDNPFDIEVHYSLEATLNSSKSKISKKECRLVEITDADYPVYDPLPTLKTGAVFDDDRVYYLNRLSGYITLDAGEAYSNAVQPVTVRQCPYNTYPEHGNHNNTMLNCIKNHYYHNSHDGLCLLCRLENRTSCKDYGFETFIIPTVVMEQAPASIDHVLLNDKNAQYNGNNIRLDNNTIIYLDNGHKVKYGL